MSLLVTCISRAQLVRISCTPRAVLFDLHLEHLVNHEGSYHPWNPFVLLTPFVEEGEAGTIFLGDGFLSAVLDAGSNMILCWIVDVKFVADLSTIIQRLTVRITTKQRPTVEVNRELLEGFTSRHKRLIISRVCKSRPVSLLFLLCPDGTEPSLDF